MRSVEVSGKTVDEAITQALLQLGASSDQVDIEILEEGNKGLLGLFHKGARIRATMKEGEEAVVETDEARMAMMRGDIRDVPVTPETENAAETPSAPTEKKTFVTATGEHVTMEDTVEQRLKKLKEGGEKETGREERPERGPKNHRHREREKDALPEKEAFQREEKVYEIPADAEEVKQRAVAFLQDVLKAMGIETAIEAGFSEDAILELNISGEGMGVIIGKRGTTLDSLQYLTTLVINKGREDHVRVKLDTEGYRKRRQETLEKLAISLAKKAKRTGHRVALEPMNPYERRIIHSVLQGDHGVETHSDGEEPYRKVIITPRKKR